MGRYVEYRRAPTTYKPAPGHPAKRSIDYVWVCACYSGIVSGHPDALVRSGHLIATPGPMLYTFGEDPAPEYPFGACCLDHCPPLDNTRPDGSLHHCPTCRRVFVWETDESEGSAWWPT